jgi:hypothetical protein
MIRHALFRTGKRHPAAVDAMAHDIYIVEYPKSGITWLCTLLANAALCHAGRQLQVTYYNVQHFIPDIHMAAGLPLGGSILEGVPQRLIKSHSGFNPWYQNVIYLARHPLDVMKSYHTYLNQQTGRHITPHRLVTDRRFGVPAWKAHVNGWLANGSQEKRLHLVRYEDLILDTAAALRAIADNLGWPFSDTTIDRAVQLSAAANMKASEERYRAHNPNYRMEFVRKKAVTFDAGTSEAIRHACRNELKLLGYPDE